MTTQTLAQQAIAEDWGTRRIAAEAARHGLTFADVQTAINDAMGIHITREDAEAAERATEAARRAGMLA